MLSHNQIKHISALKVKKFREEHQQFIAEGNKLVMDMVNSTFHIAGIYASSEWILANLPLVRKNNIPVFETLPREMDRISALSTPSPVLAVIDIPSLNQHISTLSHHHITTLTLALDDIRDPGNFGTIIRIADWFGIETVLCSESCVDLYNPKVVQATMGSIARVKVIHCNLVETIHSLSAAAIQTRLLPSFPVYGTFLEGDPLFSQPLTDHGVIVIGNESRGISQELIPLITQKLFIPSFASSTPGKAESLNASIAAAIICAEFRRGKGN
jgi:TrmH family RNA methyltransferase